MEELATSLSRLAPELAVLSVVLWYLDRRDKKLEEKDQANREAHRQTFDKMNENIDRNTQAVAKNTDLVAETVKYLKHRNGTFEALIKDAPALHKMAQRAHGRRGGK